MCRLFRGGLAVELWGVGGGWEFVRVFTELGDALGVVELGLPNKADGRGDEG